jgi:outer membrane protein
VNARARIYLLLLAAPLAALAQEPMTLVEAVRRSNATYPAIRSSIEQVGTATEGINLARTAFLPRADFIGQLNRATHNNVFGLLLPQTVIPTISGPALGTNSFSSVWGSAVGALVTWEPVDFGLRKANVETAQAVREKAAADVTVTRLQVGIATADAFLTLAAAEQTIVAARSGVERARVLSEVIGTLAKNELRPGADASRSQAELALARTLLIQAEQARDVARAALAQLLPADPETVSINATAVLGSPTPLAERPPANAARHPLALADEAAVAEVKAREKALNRSYYPRLYLQAAQYARGTGITHDGRIGGQASGLGPNTQNWALGASITFPAFDFFSIRARKGIEAHNERSAEARYAQTLQDVTGEIEKAKAVLVGARRVAENTPIQLSAARATEQQATARYRAGLADITEVAEAERLLTQAEIDDSLARLGVWRALLGVAAAAGDLTPFLTAVPK